MSPFSPFPPSPLSPLSPLGPGGPWTTVPDPVPETLGFLFNSSCNWSIFFCNALYFSIFSFFASEIDLFIDSVSDFFNVLTSDLVSLSLLIESELNSFIAVVVVEMAFANLLLRLLSLSLISFLSESPVCLISFLEALISLFILELEELSELILPSTEKSLPLTESSVPSTEEILPSTEEILELISLSIFLKISLFLLIVDRKSSAVLFNSSLMPLS